MAEQVDELRHPRQVGPHRVREPAGQRLLDAAEVASSVSVPVRRPVPPSPSRRSSRLARSDTSRACSWSRSRAISASAASERCRIDGDDVVRRLGEEALVARASGRSASRSFSAAASCLASRAFSASRSTAPDRSSPTRTPGGGEHREAVRHARRRRSTVQVGERTEVRRPGVEVADERRRHLPAGLQTLLGAEPAHLGDQVLEAAHLGLGRRVGAPGRRRPGRGRPPSRRRSRPARAPR